MVHSVKIRIDRKDLFALCVNLAYFPPNIIERFSGGFNTMQRYVQILFIVIVLLLIIKKQKLSFSVSHVLWGIFCLYSFALTFILHRDVLYAYLTRVFVPIFSPILLIIYYKTEKNGLERFINCMAKYWAAIIVLNALFMLLYPHGIIQSTTGATMERANWLIGSKNNVVLPLIFAVSVLLIKYQQAERKKRLGYYFLFFLIIFELTCTGSLGVELMGGSSTGIVALAFFLVLFSFRKLLYRLKLDNYLSVGMLALLFLLVSIFVIGGTINTNSFLGALYGLLGKDPTASRRGVLWAVELSMIAQAPVFGHGFLITPFVSNMTGSYNLYLECLFRYGVVGLVLVFAAFFSYRNKRNRYGGSMESYIFWVGIACIFMCFVVSSIQWEYMVLLMELYASTRPETGSPDGGVLRA